MADSKLTALTAAGAADDTDLFYAVQDVSTVPAAKKLSWSSLKANIKAYTDTLYATLAQFSTLSGQVSDNETDITNLTAQVTQNETGWVDSGETWTYASADAPTFTFTISGDVSTKYSAGMRVKLTQTTVKYFIITKVAYGAPNTTITIYGGTDYTLANAAISNNYYSVTKAPAGFPLDPSKWTVTVTDTSDRAQASPTINVWYNPGSITISVPIGIWRMSYKLRMDVSVASATVLNIRSTLSTANNSESDTNATMSHSTSGTALTTMGPSVYHSYILTATSKTSYYLNIMTATGSMASINIRGDVIPTKILAECAYL